MRIAIRIYCRPISRKAKKTGIAHRSVQYTCVSANQRKDVLAEIAASGIRRNTDTAMCVCEHTDERRGCGERCCTMDDTAS
jgi:hypothetical protein